MACFLDFLEKCNVIYLWVLGFVSDFKTGWTAQLASPRKSLEEEERVF